MFIHILYKSMSHCLFFHRKSKKKEKKVFSFSMSEMFRFYIGIYNDTSQFNELHCDFDIDQFIKKNENTQIL